ncbi:TerB family tellurite resistance protein [Alteromonas macleodii]|uniref:TerB family tellurite resistance protein n=1 Tax=Alteromonas macleodii TaxID=28108 RepID=UPI0019273712|nr:TerB family tellurite resistance protein [Alteromonas macleodii]MBL3884657.1 TerB family tellurite resistance protein [Alteromonas macleodii]
MQNTVIESLIQRHPGISSQKDLLCYVLSALTWSIAKADGAIQDEEKSEIPKIIEGLGVISTRSQLDSYLCGMRDVVKAQIKFHEVIRLLDVFQTKEQRFTLLRCLIKVASADGTLDKAEYTVITKVAQAFEISVPQFEQLADKLNIETGNAARKRKFEIASGVVKTVGKGAVITAAVGVALIAMLLIDGGKSSGRASSRSNKKLTSSGNKEPKAQSHQTTTQYIHRKGGRKCALCSHWRGDRQVNWKKNQVSVDASGQPRGACAKSPGGKRLVLSVHTCNEFDSVV